jgi:ribonuclease HI
MLIACDGSSFKNGDPATPTGWAWAREDGAWASTGMVGGTNNSAELHGILSILAFHPRGPLTILMDSQYALNIAEKWAFGWEKKGWRKADGKPIQNLAIVKAIVRLRHKREDPVEFQWVKAHRKDSHPLNVAADEQAGLAMRRAQLLTDPKAITYLDSRGRTESAVETKLNQFLYSAS